MDTKEQLLSIKTDLIIEMSMTDKNSEEYNELYEEYLEVCDKLEEKRKQEED